MEDEGPITEVVENGEFFLRPADLEPVGSLNTHLLELCSLF